MNPSYSSAFFAAHREGARRSARIIVPFVLELAPVRSVIDVGCGQGTWLSVFAEHGVTDVFGVDGAYVDRDQLEIPADRFQAHDLTASVPIDRTFDLAVSLEVAEHLPADAADRFVGLLTRLAPVILFSAAAPYQGGQNHINEQWPAYWAKRFAVWDYLPIDCIRRRVWNHPDVDWWYAQNTFLYAQRRQLAGDSRLQREREAAGPDSLPLVHPRRYVEWIEWGLGLCGGETSAAARHGVME